MTFLKGIPVEEATGLVREIYEKELNDQGSVKDLTKVFSMRPEFREVWNKIDNALRANMQERHYELATIAATTAIGATS